MEINYGKTTCMIVGTQHRTKNTLPLNICIDGNKIKDVKKQKLLGIYIDENLRWTDHIDHLCANIPSKRISSDKASNLPKRDVPFILLK